MEFGRVGEACCRRVGGGRRISSAVWLAAIVSSTLLPKWIVEGWELFKSDLGVGCSNCRDRVWGLGLRVQGLDSQSTSAQPRSLYLSISLSLHIVVVIRDKDSGFQTHNRQVLSQGPPRPLPHIIISRKSMHFIVGLGIARIARPGTHSSSPSTTPRSPCPPAPSLHRRRGWPHNLREFYFKIGFVWSVNRCM